VQVNVWGLACPEVPIFVSLCATVKDDYPAQNAVFDPVPYDIGFALGLNVVVDVSVVVKDAWTWRHGLPRFFRFVVGPRHDPIHNGVDIAFVDAEVELVEKSAELVKGHSNHFDQACIEHFGARSRPLERIDKLDLVNPVLRHRG
jgi:hypothetical protein